ncbi:glycosyltransferase family 2 protein [Kitasatospora sp. NPDC093550]|uniref:glycosyltransferase family 2 protein n=1 Tax=Kitasatospora sp. NPDC093550 TaxID=3364089 RepID=UPI00382CCD47
MTVRTAVITLAHGRHRHLSRQHEALAGSSLPADTYVVVAVNDPHIADGLPEPTPQPLITHLEAGAGTGLPLAAARNQGARRALREAADVLVFLDVDCIPSGGLLHRYTRSLALTGGTGVHCGPVAYLPPAPADGYPVTGLADLARPHPARPAPLPGHVLLGGDEDYLLFWSLSFALTARTWRTVGGFCEDYTGYGGEDTDFGQLLRRSGVPLYWTGGATAFHQHHAVEDPPVRHLDSILRNAALFHRRWGWWPMEGWLQAFEALGMAHLETRTGVWTRTAG